MSPDLERDPETYAIIGAAMAVHREMGHGFSEPVYQAAFEIELNARSIPFEREVDLAVKYKGEALPIAYRADFVCYDQIIVELKAIIAVESKDQAEVINYLKATDLECGLLINFGGSSLEYKRCIFSKSDLSKSV